MVRDLINSPKHLEISKGYFMNNNVGLQVDEEIEPKQCQRPVKKMFLKDARDGLAS